MLCNDRYYIMYVSLRHRADLNLLRSVLYCRQTSRYELTISKKKQSQWARSFGFESEIVVMSQAETKGVSYGTSRDFSLPRG